MKRFAVITNEKVSNIIIAADLETAEAVTGESCLEFTEDKAIAIEDNLDAATIKKIKDARAKKAADEAKAKAKAEADRVKAIEAENERLRNLEAARIAAEEAAKPKPVTGVFVRVEPN